MSDLTRNNIKEMVVDVLLITGSIILAAAIILFVMWYPVIDRMIDPCKYYPQAFIDCQIKEDL